MPYTQPASRSSCGPQQHKDVVIFLLFNINHLKCCVFNASLFGQILSVILQIILTPFLDRKHHFTVLQKKKGSRFPVVHFSICPIYSVIYKGTLHHTY